MSTTLSLPIREREVDSERVIRVMIAAEMIPDFCLNLVLLERDLVRSVLLSPSEGTGGPRIELHKADDLEEGLGRAIAQRSNGKLVVALSVRELGAWLAFFLRAYRDGEAEVDHLDIDIREASRVSLVLETDRARDPVSAEEARRILGMD